MEQKETKIIASYTFSKMTYKILRKVTNIIKKRPEKIFDEWFNYNYKIKPDEEDFLSELIHEEGMYLQNYNEELLKACFIIPLLNKVKFKTENFRDWYSYEISAIVNGYELSGKPDFMVATGTIEPGKPYFFFQEFKKSRTTSNPDYQVLSEMAVAMEINKTNILRGVYNIGKWWTFVILKKLNKDKYEYYESSSFDSLKINELKQIYINLQAVKHKYCK